jgi:iron complex outermembrane recepter protein
MKISFLAGVSALSIVLAASPAFAQDAPPAPASVDQDASAAASDDTQVNEITVTAQRVSQPLQRVPVAVQPVTGAELENRKLNDLTQLQTAAPSLQVQGENQFFVRGVGSLSFSPTVDSSVGIAVDDVSLGVPLFMSNGILDDVSQVEVLLGPQGLLFGRNASAGLLNVVTNKPELGRFSGRVYAEADYRDTLPGKKWGGIFKGTLNVPLGDSAAFRINGFYEDQDPITDVVAVVPGTRVDDYRRRIGARAKLLVEPADGLSIYVLGDFSKESGIGGVFDRSDRYFAPGSLTGVFAGVNGITAGPRNFDVGVSGDYYRNVETGGASANISYEVGDGLTISNIFAYRAYKARFNLEQDLTTFDGLDVNTNDSSYRQLSNELRLAWSSNPFIDGQVGLYYFNSRLQSNSRIGAAAFGALDPFPGFFNSETNPAIGTDQRSVFRVESKAAFGQFNLHPTQQLTLILGGRVTRDDVSQDAISSSALFAYPIPLGPVITPPGRRDGIDNTDFSWKLGAQYQFSDTVMGYATYSKGYKGPSLNFPRAAVGGDLGVGPETVRAIELGLKTTLLDRRLRLNFSAFRQNFSDFQVQGFDVGSQSFFLGNAAKVRSQGFEVIADAKPVRGLSINVAATFLDSKFTSFSNDTCYPGQPASTCIGGVSNSSGHRTPGSAKFVSTVSATYERPISNDVAVFLSGNYYHRSSIFFDSTNNPNTSLGPIDVFGFNVGARINDTIKIELFCKNCTNKVYPLQIGGDAVDGTLLNLNSTVQIWGYNSVRTIGAAVSFNF